MEWGSGVVDVYGAVLAPTRPVSSLTRNVAWALTAVLGLLIRATRMASMIPQPV